MSIATNARWQLAVLHRYNHRKPTCHLGYTTHCLCAVCAGHVWTPATLTSLIFHPVFENIWKHNHSWLQRKHWHWYSEGTSNSLMFKINIHQILLKLNDALQGVRKTQEPTRVPGSIETHYLSISTLSFNVNAVCFTRKESNEYKNTLDVRFIRNSCTFMQSSNRPIMWQRYNIT